MSNRLSVIRQFVKEAKVDVFWVKKPENVFYLSGLEASSASLLIAKNSAYLIVDSRYFQKAKKAANLKVELLKEDFSQYLSEFVTKKKISSLAFESNYLTYAQFEALRKVSPLKLVSTDNWVEKVRQVKEKAEILAIQKAAKLADKTMAFAKHSISAGITEIELAKKIECFIRENGARAEAFETIVASGPNAANPHHSSTNRHIQPGDTLLIDLGAKLNSYRSDITRTFLIEPVKPALQEFYSTCLEAQEKALTKLKDGIGANEVDEEARSLINQKYPDKFGHNLGHGVGLEIHELPIVGPKSKEKLTENMVITIEPGIYIERKGGVRIEDMAHITKNGYKLLTKSPKQLEEIIIEL